jgi:cytochrome c-type biogenesis protein CcsB
VGVDVGLARLSNDLIVGGIAAYSVAFLGYAIDAAFGNHVPAVATETAAAIDVRQPALVGVTAHDANQSRGADWTSSASGPRTPGVRLARTNAAARGVGGFLSARTGQFAVAVTVVGWLLHLGAVVTRGLSVHRLPWGNMYEFTLAFTLTVVTAFLVIMMRQPARYLGVFVMTPVVLALGVAVLVLYVAPAPLVPALHSFWLAIHVTAAIIASGVFTVATAATFMFLIADRYAVAMASGKPVRFSALARIMPAPEVLDRTAYRAYAFAFPVWTFAVIAGAIWAEYAWGHYWQWDPKETWAFITWVIYAGYLHARATAGWRGRKAAYVAMLGFTSIVFNFFIVNIFITGMHSYAGV